MRNWVAALGGAMGAVSWLLPWLNFRPNRLLSGQAQSLWNGPNVWGYAALIFWLLTLVLAFLKLKSSERAVPLRGWMLGALVALATISSGFYLQVSSETLTGAAGELSRASLSGGAWLSLLALYVAGFGVGQEARFAAWLGPLGLLGLFFVGAFSSLGPAVELRGVADSFGPELVRHLALSFTALLLSALVGIPLGIAAARSPALAGPVLGGAGFLQTVPSLSLFGLLLPPLAALGRGTTLGTLLLWLLGSSAIAFFISRIPLGGRVAGTVKLILSSIFGALSVSTGLLIVGMLLYNVFTGNLEALGNFQPSSVLADIGVRGIGAAPALIALTLYALLPIVVNTYVGLRNVPEGVRDAARGMGMNPTQSLFRAELPLSLPFLFEGLRSSLVLTLGIATIAALIGAGGLGFFVQRGVEGSIPDLVLLGAAPVVILALLGDALVKGLARVFVPKGL